MASHRYTVLTADNIVDVVFNRTQESISTEIEGETVILNMESGKYCGLNEVGTAIWQHLEHQTTFAELKSKILEEFDVSEEQCAEHLLGFLNELAANKLIKTNVTTGN